MKFGFRIQINEIILFSIVNLGRTSIASAPLLYLLSLLKGHFLVWVHPIFMMTLTFNCFSFASINSLFLIDVFPQTNFSILYVFLIIFWGAFERPNAAWAYLMIRLEETPTESKSLRALMHSGGWSITIVIQTLACPKFAKKLAYLLPSLRTWEIFVIYKWVRISLQSKMKVVTSLLT